MKKILRNIFYGVSFILLAACGAGGGYGSGAAGYTHNELAVLFVDELNATGVYDVTLAKDSTDQFNYVVVYDHDYDSYDAINISGYKPGDNILDFMESRSGGSFYDLDLIPGYYSWDTYESYDSFCSCWVTDVRQVWVETRYRDRSSGLTFEKVSGSSKDLETYAAIAEEAVISNRAESVASKFGLSVDRSKDVVRLAMAWQKAGGKDLTAKDQDSFSKELLGFSITEAKSASQKAATGNKKAMDDLVEEAALANGTSPENIRQIVDTYFVK
jgi:hypothetical protein